VAPEQIELEFTDESKKTYGLREVLDLKEESWFQRGIALSQDCCDSIARKAKEKLIVLRTDYPQEQHQIIASAISKRHAREYVKPAFEKLGLKVGMVSSAMEDAKTNDETFQKLAQGRIDVIVHIGMLGEGFNHPPLGVAAIFRPYKTLNPYMQFIGRVIRRNGKTPVSYIVSHLGLNQLQRFEEFRLFDYEDREFLGRLFADSGLADEGSAFVDPSELARSRGGDSGDSTPLIRELGEQIVDFESRFVADGVESALSQFGKLDPRGKEAFLRKLGIDPATVNCSVGPADRRLKPVEKRKASRNLLNEKEKSITTDVLKALGLRFYNRDFNKRFNNFVWVKRRVSNTVNKHLQISKDRRKSITNAMFQEFEERGLLASVMQENVEYFGRKLGKS
jgi:DNA repair protein RadD